MGKLRSLPPRFAALPSRFAAVPGTAGSGFTRTDGRSSTARGYGQDWRRVRLQVLADEPLCRLCAEEGRVVAATDVDHIQAFHGLDDPLRLARTNLRPLCQPCHMARTARQARGTAGPTDAAKGRGGQISGAGDRRDRVPPHPEVFSGGE